MVFFDFHVTFRKSVWNSDIGKYEKDATVSKHYDLFRGKTGVCIVENRERGNKQRSEDEDLEREGKFVGNALKSVLDAVELMIQSEN